MSRWAPAPTDRSASDRLEELANGVEVLAERMSELVKRLKEENDRDPAE